ncbi:glycosyltransferase family 32 protein [Rosenbergiella epipactidis]|uniref:glycosyltransferase family 32 protein n=1 Tax=Rosenbergiella epipactidis TaxID=1544694 RepID=UPI001F4EB5AA|nr:capsular polysaccharide synthesis protein [Rosenbergiella epipactidis]
MRLSLNNIKVMLLDSSRELYTRVAIFFNISRRVAECSNDFHPIIKLDEDTKEPLPRNIWIYWNDSPPDIVLRCFELVKKLHPNWNVYFLNRKTIADFIDIDFESINAITHQQQSDAIRLELLYHYGGIWLDASVIVFHSFDKFKLTIDEKNVDLLGFYRNVNLIDRNNPVMENWFITARKKSPAIKLWRDEFYKSLSIGIKTYVDNIRLSNAKALANLYDPYYLVCYVAFQNILPKINSYVMYDCDKNAFLYHMTGGFRNWLFKRNRWGKYNLIRNVFLNKSNNIYPDMIKLTGKDRDIFNEYLTGRVFTRDSLASKIINLLEDN